MNHRLIIALAITSLASLVILLSTSIPLGIPGEWQWTRHAPIASLPAMLDRLILPLIAGGLLIGVAVFAQPKDDMQGPSKARQLLSYSLLAVVSYVWLNCVQQSTPAFHREVKPYWVLYAPSSSGYFFEAAFKIDSTTEFLASYEDRMSEGEVLHVGTHPPGLFLLAKVCLEVCESSPPLVSFLNAIESTQSRETFRQLENEARLAHPLTNQQRTALHLLSLISQLALVLTIVPLAILAMTIFSPKTAWWICCLWPTLPCLAIFFPKSDVLFPFTATFALTLSILALQGYRSTVCAVGSGIAFWAGLMLSLAHIPVTAVLFFLVLIRAIASKGESLRNDILTGLKVIATIAICSVVFLWATDCNVASVWQWNLSNHAGFYEQFQRTWYKWLLVNPIELTYAVAVPIAVTGLWGLARSVATPAQPESPNVKFGRHLTWAMTFVILLLWASGKNQGEAARLWCFMTPWILIAAGFAITALRKTQLTWLIGLQVLSAIVTVSIVNGFSF